MIMVRGYAGRALLFQDRVDEEGLGDEGMRNLIKEQLDRVVPFPKHMIEIEFLDEKSTRADIEQWDALADELGLDPW